MSKKVALISFVVLALLAVGTFAAQTHISGKVEATVAENVEKMKADSGLDITYKDVDTGFLGRSVTLNDVVMNDKQGSQIRIKTVSMSDFDQENPQNGFDLAIDGLVVEKVNPNVVAFLLGGFDPSNYPLSLHLSYIYSEKDKLLDMRDVALDVVGYCKLSGNARFSEIVLPKEGAELSSDQINSIKMDKLRLALKNDKAMDVLYSYIATQRRISPDAVRNEFLAVAKMQLTQAEQQQDTFMIDLLKAVTAFLEQPKSLEIRMEPESPVAFDELERLAPADMANRLGLNYKANSI